MQGNITYHLIEDNLFKLCGNSVRVLNGMQWVETAKLKRDILDHPEVEAIWPELRGLLS